MEFLIGPVLAVLVSVGYTRQQNTKHQKEYEALVTKVELLENRNEQVEKEMLKNIMTTVMPITKAVNKLNQKLGL